MKKYLPLLKESWKEFGDDKAARLGAALAYYTIFSIAPLLLIAISIAGMVFGQEAARGEILGQLKGLLGPTAAEAIQEMIKNAAKPKAGVFATVAGIVTLLFGASGVFTQLKDALNTIWNVPPKKSGGIMAAVKDKFLSMTMVVGVGFLLLVSLVVDAVIATMGKFASSHLPGGEFVWQVLQFAVSIGVITVLFAMIFRFLPDTKVEWRDVWLGALSTSVLFVLGKFGLSFYLGRAAVGSSYGAAGSLVVLLLWIYWSAQILFFGAEFTQVYARTHGSRIGEAPEQSEEKSAVAPERRDSQTKDRPSPKRAPAPVAAKSSGGGAGKLAVGGVLGIFLGAIVGGITATIIFVKSIKKLIVG